MKQPYIPRRGDLISFTDFNDAIGMIIESSYTLGQDHKGLVKYKFCFPDPKPFQFAREVGGNKYLFEQNHLMTVYNKPFGASIAIVLPLENLILLLERGKWKVHAKKL